MNRVTRLLSIQYPIIQGGMGNISNAKLAAAVSEAGGLGTIGCGTMSGEQVEEIILQTKELTDKPFALNIAINVSPNVDKLIELAIKHDIPVISLSAGNPTPFISKLHEHEKVVLAIVATVKHAIKAEKAGADMLVTEGYEAAGINSPYELTTFTLVPQVAQKVNVPVIAAGGIGDGKGLAAALMLGAEGVQIGTRFIATKEAPFHENYKEQLIRASGTDTVIIGRSFGRIRRVLNSSYIQELIEQEKIGVSLQDYGKFTSEKHHVLGAIKGDLSSGFLNSGQVVGLINDIPSVKDLIEDMIKTANNRMQVGATLLESIAQTN
ncbi:nitronate monooxygenase family protein [Paucisalibacillus sp. EB02]|uniref:NAD(P)H-dependent flavin oxidoreductase n=1 Tax=Paucisalibacillus sp. EB02 TaxID=1347087 RepID=UPI0004B878AA|nr:nitronate monooxygenase [Paucisalibacillus sp. EB02]